VDGVGWYKGKASCILLGNVGKLFGGVEAFEDARPDAAHRSPSRTDASLVGSIVAGGVVLPIVVAAIALVCAALLTRFLSGLARFFPHLAI